MKTFFKTLFFVLLAFGGLRGYAQCSTPSFSYSIAPGGQVTFQNSSSYFDSLSQGYTFLWKFGDGDSLQSNNATVTHSYAANGWYTVYLNVTNTALGCNQTQSDILFVNRCHPAAQFNAFNDGLGLYDFVPANQVTLPVFTYAWNFGDGGVSTSDSLFHQYTASGNYTVTLIATSSLLGCADTSTVNLHVSTCGFPLAIDTTITGQSPVQITFQSSVQGATDLYVWTFDNNAPVTAGGAVSNSYVNAGNYNVSLTETDTLTGCVGTASISFVVSGSCALPSPAFSSSFAGGGIATFTQTGYNWDTTSNGGLTYIWRFGDGDTAQNSAYQVNHTYTANGTYTVSLEILNSSLGCDTIFSQTLVVNRCYPAGQFTEELDGFGWYGFVASVQQNLPVFTYQWSFGDGGTAASNAPTHTYTASGTYPVTLIATSSILGCADTSTVNLQVNLCSLSVAIDTAILSYGPVNMQFTPSPQDAGYTYSWSFSDGGTSTGATATHAYTAGGTYTVNLSVSDATNGCSTTSTLSFQINNVCGLTAGFNNWGNGLTQEFDVYNYDSLSATVASCTWSFPGATPSTASGLNVSGITYPAIGTYSACAYIVSTGGCVDTVCSSFNITSATYAISGTASKSGGSGFAGVVYLILQDSIGHLTLIDSAVSNIDTAGVFSYYFPGLPVDTYYVKAALNTLDADYANYLPTYYGNVLNWGNATPVVISNSDVSNIDISLIAGTNPGGPGFVGGYVSQGAGLIIGNAGNSNAKSLGDPIANVQVNLLTSGNQAVAYTYTDANGRYHFANLALGSYKIYVEQLNKVPNPLDFTLTSENPVDSGANMSVNSHGTTGIGNINGMQIMEVYPNPVVSSLQLQLSSQQSANATLKVTDISGRTCVEQELKLIAGENTAEVDMTALAPGVYLMMLESGGQQVTYKIVKAK